MLPTYQGLGVGRLLAARGLAFAQAQSWPVLMIESDPNAQGFYERLGACQVGEVAAPVCGVERYLPLLQLLVNLQSGVNDAR